jgi:hypothetical protein
MTEKQYTDDELKKVIADADAVRAKAAATLQHRKEEAALAHIEPEDRKLLDRAGELFDVEFERWSKRLGRGG